MKKLFVILLLIGLIPLFADSSLEFDGIDDHVQLSSAMNIGNSSNTVEAWIKIPAVGSGNLLEGERVGILLGNYDESPNVGWEFHSDGQMRMWWNSNSGGYQFYGTTDLRDNAWHHVAFVRDVVKDSSFMYLDGVLEATYASAGPNLTITTSFYIGADRRGPDTPYFHGTVDEMRVWSTARTQAEIREYMCEDVTGSTGLLAYYQMSDDSGTSLTDNTGNGYTGTLTHMDNSDWVNDNQIPAGDGSSTPYQINGLNQLYWLSQNSANWADDFEQITDITASATDSWDGGAGFSPIGNGGIKFTGTYNGNDHSISDLSIDRQTERYNALFGYINSPGEISYLNLSNVDINGYIGTGAFCGYNYGIINRCSATGTVSSVNSDIGGILGANSGTISQCYASVTINTSGSTVGGLAGFNMGTITECVATGDVTGSGYVGGLVGWIYNNSTTSNCYATGNVNGDNYVGGFSGYVNRTSSTSYCYSTGAASGSSEVGGLIGYAAPESSYPVVPAPEINYCFWDTEASGNATSSAGTGKTTEDMKTLSTYTDSSWDFVDETVNGSNDYWGINNNEHDGYPFLSWEDYTHNYSDTPLPVTLTSFEAISDKGSVKLAWTTESETENLGYILERKSSGNDWKVIASFMTEEALGGHGTTCETHDYAYVDKNVIAGETYEYRLSDVSENNEITVIAIHEITVDASNNEMLDEFGLANAYPNPFNPVLTIQYHLTDNAQTSVKILNMTGQTIVVLDQGFRNAGNYELQWQTDDAASGIYFVQLQAGDMRSFQKVLLVK